MPFNWDEESKNKLREFWASGLSASLIGKEMGVSKNSIIGAANRMKLPPRAGPAAFAALSSSSKSQEKPVEAVQTPAPVVAVTLNRILYTPGNATMKTCRFPSGDPKKFNFRFCGKPAVTGKSYCLACCKIAYIKPSRAA